MENIERYLRLSAVAGLTGKRWLDIASALNQTDDTLQVLISAGLNQQQRHQFTQLSSRQIAATEAWLAASDDHHLITALDNRYPAALREIHRFPPLLYIKGEPALLSSMQLAVVGSRNCSHYGRQWGEWFTRQLALSDLTITSGLARGIDGIAHRAALEAQGKTVAVLGSGLQHLYPKNHGAQPHWLVMCHEMGRPHMRHLPHQPMVGLADCVEANLRAAQVTSDNPQLAGFAINTSNFSEEEARDYCTQLSETFGVPATDPVRFGIDAIATLLKERG